MSDENVMEALAKQIERVTRIHANAQNLARMPGVNVSFILSMTRRSLDEAQAAIGSDDPARVIRALKDLQDFKE